MDDPNFQINYDKSTNSLELVIANEGHTLGNMVVEKLLEDSRFLFAAYKVKHPLEKVLRIKAKVIEDVNVVLIVLSILKDLKEDIDALIKQFKNAKD